MSNNASMSVLDYSNNNPTKLSFYLGVKDGGTGAAESPFISRNHTRANATSNESLNAREINVCRICLCEDEPANHLIWPCKCSGSMGAIHISCLKEWLNGKRIVYDGNKVTSYFWKALECELCKEPFENKLRSSLFSIMQFDKPEKNYMILESIKSAPAKVVHVFDLRYDSFAIGRSIETDMKIADISVSRTHSFVKIINGKICVEDNGSKFGTLVKIQRPLDLLRVNAGFTSTIFQIGRTLIYLQLTTSRENNIKFECKRRINTVTVENGNANGFLKLSKDNLNVPSEFCMAHRLVKGSIEEKVY